jgi:hypothetical protein
VERRLRFLAPEQLAVDVRQQVFALEALLR